MEAVQGPRRTAGGGEHHLNGRAFLAACFGHAMCHGAKLALPLVTLTAGARAFEVDPARMGWVLSAFTLAMGATSLPAGLLGDRFGTGRVLVAYFWFLGLAAAACALATSFATFLAAHALLGAAAGLFHPAGLGLLSLVTPGDKIGVALGRFGVAGSVGTAVMPFAMGSLLGWRAGFVLIAAAGLCGGLWCQLGLRRGWLPTGRRPATQALQREGDRRDDLLLLLVVVMSVNAFLSAGWETIFPQTVADHGGEVFQDWHLATLVLLVGGVGQFMGGSLARDAFAAGRMALILVAQCLVLLGTAIALGRGAMPLVLLGAFAFLNYGTQPVENRLLAAFTSTRRRSTAYALKFLVALVVASPAPWIVAGLYAEGGDARPAYRLLSAVALLAVAAAWVFLRRERTRRQAPRVR